MIPVPLPLPRSIFLSFSFTRARQDTTKPGPTTRRPFLPALPRHAPHRLPLASVTWAGQRARATRTLLAGRHPLLPSLSAFPTPRGRSVTLRNSPSTHLDSLESPSLLCARGALGRVLHRGPTDPTRGLGSQPHTLAFVYSAVQYGFDRCTKQYNTVFTLYSTSASSRVVLCLLSRVESSAPFTLP